MCNDRWRSAGRMAKSQVNRSPALFLNKRSVVVLEILLQGPFPAKGPWRSISRTTTERLFRNSAGLLLTWLFAIRPAERHLSLHIPASQPFQEMEDIAAGELC